MWSSVIALAVWAGLVWWGVRQVEGDWNAEGEFVRIPAGRFEMGSPETEAGSYPNERPVHHVCIRSIEIGRFEITQGQWRQVMVLINPAPAYFSSKRIIISQLRA